MKPPVDQVIISNLLWCFIELTVVLCWFFEQFCSRMDDELAVAARNILPAKKGKGRKKGQTPEKWKKNVIKRQRYTAPGFPQKPQCTHPQNKNDFECESVSMQDARRFHQLFYREPSRGTQNDFILKYVKVFTPLRRRSRCDKFQKDVTTQYYIPVKRGTSLTVNRVCQKLFLSVLCIKKDRVQLLCKRFMSDGDTYKERRGGDKRGEKYKDKRAAVKYFIESISAVESHYNRSKNVTRYYLKSDLSIKKLHSMYFEKNPAEDLQVKYEYFRSVFVTDYNISFNAPATDACSTCISLKEQAARCTVEAEKNIHEASLKIHLIRAACFYQSLQSVEPNVMAFSFDCQKNLVLPKVPDQAAYYSRQFYLYNLTVCQGSSKSPLKPDNTFAYMWLESEFDKASNQVASIVYDRLTKTSFPETVEIVRLFADGCGGQNKNSIVEFMACLWLKDSAPTHIMQVEIMFLVVGHSFMPPDRVFGVLEREFHRRSEIVTPEEYISIISKQATVVRLGESCTVFDFKGRMNEVVKKTTAWHFQFNKCKRLVVTLSQQTKVPMVRGEPAYRSDLGAGKSILKKGKRFDTITNVHFIPKGRGLNPKKIEDVSTLLSKHFGENWDADPRLNYYKTIICGENQSVPNSDEDLEEQEENEDVGEDVVILENGVFADEVITEEEANSIIQAAEAHKFTK